MTKPNGWKGKKTDIWWTKDSAYGVRYKCPECGKESLGIVWGQAEKTMHWRECSRRIKIEELRNELI
jgi:hypothetical protein